MQSAKSRGGSRNEMNHLQLGGVVGQGDGHTGQTLLTAIDDPVRTATWVRTAVLRPAFHRCVLRQT